MTGRERILAALRGGKLDRIPRQYAALPGFCRQHPGIVERFERRYPQDVVHVGFAWPREAVKGDPFAVGTYVDEWGCAFENAHAGIIGQVKHPVLGSYDGLASYRPPAHLVPARIDDVLRACEATDCFVLTGTPLQPFERMQFLRGTENLFYDLIEQPAELFRLRDMVHEVNLRQLEVWCRTPVDGIMLADDWGTQHALLISPDLWRSLFRPLYAEYIAIARRAGKFAYMHSDGYVMAILEDLIDLGLDAVNAQVTCMDLAELGRRFRGRITFWGQMDRQHMLCFGSTQDARHAAREFYDHLAAPGGGRIVCQMHIEPGTRPGNIEAVLDEFERIPLG